tara:strand:- start:449 stop:727 length:279 start_codon:yes stop_codon:yes gene_type:complete
MSEDNNTIKLEQGTPVYHIEYGKGRIVSFNWRKKNPLFGCSFGKHGWEFVTLNELLTYSGEVTLEPMEQERTSTVDDQLKSALEDLLGFTGK